MIAPTGTELLREQLEAALAEIERGEGHPLEAAALAGLLQRTEVAPEMELPEIPADRIAAAALEAADAVIGCEPHHDEAEVWDALSALDETCAAATWLGVPHLVHAYVQDAVGFVRADPDTWQPHAPAATELLRTQPPLSSDPARLLWAAVEASRWAHDEPDAEGEAPAGLKERLGIPIVIDLAPFLAVSQRLAAADQISTEDLPTRMLATGDGWELHLTLDEDDRPKLVLLGAGEELFTRDGMEVHLVQDPDEGRSTLAHPGIWELRVAGRTFVVHLEAPE